MRFRTIQWQLFLIQKKDTDNRQNMREKMMKEKVSEISQNVETLQKKNRKKTRNTQYWMHLYQTMKRPEGMQNAGKRYATKKTPTEENVDFATCQNGAQ